MGGSICICLLKYLNLVALDVKVRLISVNLQFFAHWLVSFPTSVAILFESECDAIFTTALKRDFNFIFDKIYINYTLVDLCSIGWVS